MVLSTYLILCSSLSCWIERKLGLLLRNQDWGVRKVGASCYRQACCVTGQIVLPCFTLASPCVTRGGLLISLAGGSTRCLPVGSVKSFENAAFEGWTVLLQWVLDDWTCLTALCGAKKWLGLCIILIKGRQFLRQLLKLNSIYHFNARIHFNLDTIQGAATSKIRGWIRQPYQNIPSATPEPALSFGSWEPLMERITYYA